MLVFSRLTRKIGELYNNINNSIALYPIIITVFYLLLAVLMMRFDHSSTAQILIQRFSWLEFKEMETGRTILSTLITGIISLMAFSFSMVMVVLSQAISIYSPKIMIGLVSEKPHQFVLGNQLGAIIYFIILLMHTKEVENLIVPSLSITLSIFLAVWSMILFVYFIHTISQSVQITNIIKGIHDLTLKSLYNLAKETANCREPDTSKFTKLEYAYITDKPGFLQEVHVKKIIKLAEKRDMVICMHGYLTNYIETRRTLFHANIPPSELSEAEKSLIYNSIIFYHNENVKSNYVYGFTQLSEVAVKALSPGINDPGIARLCIQYLTDMFIQFYYTEEKEVFTDQKGKIRLIVNKISFDELLNTCVTPIRQYGKKDLSIVKALLEMVQSIGEQDIKERRYQQSINQQAEAILADCRKEMYTAFDLRDINTMIDKMHSTGKSYFCLDKLELVS